VIIIGIMGDKGELKDIIARYARTSMFLVGFELALTDT
jgi:hypothetical protein